MEKTEKKLIFTRIAAGLAFNVRDLMDWGIEGGHTTAEELLFTVSARKEAVSKLHDVGLSHRQIAKAVGQARTLYFTIFVIEIDQNLTQIDQNPSQRKPPHPLNP